MKKKSLLFPAIICFLTANCIPTAADAQEFSNAAEYMEYMSEEYDDISKDLWQYTKSAAHGKRAKKVEKKRKELLKTTSNAQKKIKKMPDYEGDVSLRDSVVSFLKMSYILLDEDYGKIVDLEEIAEQSYDAMEAYLKAKEVANEKFDKAGDMLETVQKTFADEHNITLVDKEDRISRKLGIANEVIKYYNPVYLIFFRSYKQEAYLLEALEKRDMSAVEQNKNALLEYSEGGIKKLSTIHSYKGDASLKSACLKMLRFYKDEAENKIQVYSDYYMEKEKFENIRKNFESKPQNKLTQEEVDEFNKAVNEFNELVDKFNKVNQELNEERQELINSWNKTADKFMDKHVP